MLTAESPLLNWLFRTTEKITMNLFLKILGGVAVAGAALCTGGVLPASLGVVFTLVGTVAAALHPSPAAVSAFGKEAK